MVEKKDNGGIIHAYICIVYIYVYVYSIYICIVYIIHTSVLKHAHARLSEQVTIIYEKKRDNC